MYNLCIWIGLIRRFAVKEPVANKALVQGDIGSSEYSTALTATVGITLNGRDTVCKGSTVCLTYDDVCLTRDIGCIRSIDISDMLTHTASPATTIDITYLATFDIGCTAGCEAFNMFVFVVKTGRCHAEAVTHGATGACSIEVFDDCATQQIDVGASIDVTTTENALFHLCRVTHTATISIVPNGSSFVDVDVRMVFSS